MTTATAMVTLTRYLSLKLFWSALGVTLAFTALVQILDLLDTTEDILRIGEGARGFAFYVVMRLPSIVPEVMPLGILIAALFTLALLVRNGEVVAMQAAGVRIGQMVGAMLPAVVVLALGHYMISDHLRPPAEARLAGWWAEHADRTGTKAGDPVWLKAGAAVVQIDRVRDRGRRLEGLRIYDRDARDAVVLRTTAGVARYRDSRWTLEAAVATDWRRGHVDETRPADGEWRTRLRPANVLEAMMPEARVSAQAAYEVLYGHRLAIGAPPVYATALQRAFAEPATSVVMLLLAAPLASARGRGGRGGRLFLLALGAGLLFLLADGLTATLGRAGVIQPVLAAWAPALLFSLLGVALIRRAERP